MESSCVKLRKTCCSLVVMDKKLLSCFRLTLHDWHRVIRILRVKLSRSCHWIVCLKHDLSCLCQVVAVTNRCQSLSSRQLNGADKTSHSSSLMALHVHGQTPSSWMTLQRSVIQPAGLHKAHKGSGGNFRPGAVFRLRLSSGSGKGWNVGCAECNKIL